MQLEPTAAAADAMEEDVAPSMAEQSIGGEASTTVDSNKEQKHEESMQQEQQQQLDGSSPQKQGPKGHQHSSRPHRDQHMFDDSLTVFVKGMGRLVFESDLRRLFADVGTIKAVRVARDYLHNTPRVRGDARVSDRSLPYLQGLLC